MKLLRKTKVWLLWREWRNMRAAPLVILVGPVSEMSGVELRDLMFRVEDRGRVTGCQFIMHDNYPPDQALFAFRPVDGL